MTRTTKFWMVGAATAILMVAGCIGTIILWVVSAVSPDPIDEYRVARGSFEVRVQALREGIGLNAPGGNIRGDLELLGEVFLAWLSNFPREGNPVGENHEITAALTGENRLQFALVPKGHRNGIELAWVDLVNGDAALATALQASLGSTG